jgi:hypothetical protein
MQGAEGAIHKLKRGVSQKMINTGAPKALWDHCLELEARIRSHTANGIYEAGGQVPETIMTGGTADISHIGKYGWFDWVLFRDLAIKDRTLDRTFARYLIGPAVN